MKPTEPNDAKILKITAQEKEFLLSQVQIVLSECQRLVSQLSTAQIEENSNFKVKVLCQKVVAPSLNLLSKDVLHTLAYDCDVSSSDDDVSSVRSHSSLLSWDIKEDYPVHPMSEEMSKESCLIVRKITPNKCSFINKIVDFISSFPNNVYTTERSCQLKQEILNENVFPEFQTMWMNVGDLFIQKPEDSDDSAQISTTPEIVYKSIDFSKVNVRNMANIPKPTSYPVHGVSNDPDFYTKVVKLDYIDYWGNQRMLNSSFIKKAPFGSIYGYQTNEGIVPVPDVPVHGHVWSDHLHDWVLHAVFPDEIAPAPWRGTRSPTKRRPPSTRRGWPTSRARREGK